MRTASPKPGAYYRYQRPAWRRPLIVLIVIALLLAAGAYFAYSAYQRYVVQVLTVPGCQAGTGQNVVPLDFSQAADAATVAAVAVREKLPAQALTVAYEPFDLAATSAEAAQSAAGWTVERVLVAFRQPAKLGAISITDGSVAALVDACADADDMFFDRKRRRVYVTCGEGVIDVFDAKGNDYRRLARVATVRGARTSLLVPDLDRFVVAARVQAGEPAAVWIFRPTD